MGIDGGWILEVDIRKFFDTLDHARLRDFLRHRIRDGVLLRLIGKWLNAGVLEDGACRIRKPGLPREASFRPPGQCLLALCAGRLVRAGSEATAERSFVSIRYADDFVMGFTCEEDARRVMEVLPKRFGNTA